MQRSLKFVKYLPPLGYRPIVITVNPIKASYPLTDDSLAREAAHIPDVIRTSTFEPFHFYKWLSGRNTLPKPGFAGEEKPGFLKSVTRFLRGNLFIPDPRKGWNRFLIREALHQIQTRDVKLLLTSSPPHSTQLAGLRLKQMSGLPWIADMRDPWTDIYYYHEFRHLPFVKRWDQRLERKVLEQADAVIVVSQGIKDLFCSKSPRIRPEKIHIIPNGFDPEDFTGTVEKDVRYFTMAYTGTLAEDYDVRALIKALKEIQEDSPGLPIRILLTGKISPWIRESMAYAGLSGMLTIEDYQSHSEAILKMRKADVLLLVIPRIDNNKGILTGKLFEYMAAGNPVLGIGPVKGDAAEMLRETMCGEMYDYEDSEGIRSFLAEQIQGWIYHRTETTHTTELLKYSRVEQSRQLSDVMDSLL